MVVEDNPGQMVLIQRSFETSPLEAKVNLAIAQDFTRALEIINTNRIDLLITDMNLPDGKGSDFLSLSNKKSDFPIVIMTSGGDEDLAVQSIKKGALDYVVKSPEIFQQLPRMARKWIQEWQVIEENRRQEIRMIERQVELEEANNELRKIAYSISHDLATPVVGILKLSEWIEESLTNADGEVKTNLQLLRNRVLRLKNFMDGIVDYSNLSSVENIETVKVVPLLSRVINSLDVPNDTSISLHVPDIEIEANSFLFSKLFQHLIRNAIQHNPEIAVSISISCSEESDRYIFSIKDDGKGIPIKHHEKIFEMFHILGRRDENENIGMGLTMAKKIVNNAHGKLWIEPSDGNGAFFKFTWPKKEKTPHKSLP